MLHCRQRHILHSETVYVAVCQINSPCRCTILLPIACPKDFFSLSSGVHAWWSDIAEANNLIKSVSFWVGVGATGVSTVVGGGGSALSSCAGSGSSGSFEIPASKRGQH